MCRSPDGFGLPDRIGLLGRSGECGGQPAELGQRSRVRRLLTESQRAMLESVGQPAPLGELLCCVQAQRQVLSARL
jgi:hypothetical protein